MAPLCCALPLLATSLGVGLPPTSPQTHDGSQKKVLVFHLMRKDDAAVLINERTYQKVLTEGLAGQVDYYSEYVDLARFDGTEYQTAFRDFLKERYKKSDFDVIIATADLRNFLARYGADVFPNTPVVFAMSEDTFDNNATPSNFAGIVYDTNLRGTLEIIRSLQPGVRRVFVITGASKAVDQWHEARARKQFKDYDGFEFTYLSGLPMNELKGRISRLAPDSVVYFVMMAEDGAGQRFATADALDQIVASSSVPVYTWHDSFLGHGVIGGKLASSEKVATRTAELALRILRGERPEAIPLTKADTSLLAFDWRQLQRWKLDEDRLPPQSIIRFKELSFWQSYRWEIFGVISLCILEAVLISALLVQRAHRKRVQEGLSRSERALRDSHSRIRDLAGRLIEAQDQERQHIAREMHDDLVQQVAVIGVGLSTLKRRLAADDVAARDRILLLQEQVNRLNEWIRRLSHELHSSTLHHLGLVAALRDYCREFTDAHGVAVNLDIPDVFEPIEENLSVCIFRIVQEALHNIAKHADTQTAEVKLTRENNELSLAVRDRGVGFDPKRTVAGHGLGLISMKERVKLFNGTFEVNTSPGAGTEVSVRIPLQKNHEKSAGVAG
jgi:signal transduction histidine kinase/ABC-type uncharacterized transport system substrate-binding protein